MTLLAAVVEVTSEVVVTQAESPPCPKGPNPRVYFEGPMQSRSGRAGFTDTGGSYAPIADSETTHGVG